MDLAKIADSGSRKAGVPENAGKVSVAIHNYSEQDTILYLFIDNTTFTRYI
jgi:hypothetical protein